MNFKKLIAFLPIIILNGCGSDSSDNPEASFNNPQNPFGDGPGAVSLAVGGGNLTPGDLASAGSYVILAKAEISDTSGSVIDGYIGVSPASESAITNFPIHDHFRKFNGLMDYANCW